MRSGSAWWSRSRGLPTEAYAAWLEVHRGEQIPARILAWARTSGGFCIGGLTRLSISDGDHWTHTPWHEIERGEWNAETRSLRWKRLDGGRGAATLIEPGRMPELFRERIAATIALERFVSLAGDRGVIITARRNLVDGGSISWHSTLTRGLSWQTEGVREAADRAVAELKSEYDLG